MVYLADYSSGLNFRKQTFIRSEVRPRCIPLGINVRYSDSGTDAGASMKVNEKALPNQTSA